MRRRTALLATALLAASAALFAASPARAAAVPPSGVALPAEGVTVGPAQDVTVDSAQSGAATGTSRNWAGYVTKLASSKSDFTVVQATWKQPKVTCQTKTAWTVWWVGLDGWTDGTVEQGGSEAYCPTAGGAPVYDIWWEMFPTYDIQTVSAIKAGDTITAKVTYSAKTKTYTISVKDTTNSTSLTKAKKCASNLTCSRTSAEVITEDVGKTKTTYYPLAKYATTKYTGASITDTAGHKGSISNSHWTSVKVTEKAGSTTYATTSALTSGGTSFTNTWKHT